MTIISVLHFSPASRPFRIPASHPFLSRLPYPSRPLFSRAPAPLSLPSLPTIHGKLTIIRKVDCTCVSKKVQNVDLSYLPKCALISFIKNKNMFQMLG